MKETVELVLQAQSMPEDMKEALSTRLNFRQAFLKTVDTVESRSQDTKESWRETHSFISDLTSSGKLAKPFPQSFSVKLQRKLASTVPPRPIVVVGQESAYEHLERMCKDGEIAVDILDYTDSHSLMVSAISPMRIIYSLADDTYVRLLFHYFKHENLNHPCIFGLYFSITCLQI